MSLLRASQVRTRRRVDDLLGKSGRIPIDVEALAVQVGAEVRPLNIADDLAGILYWEGDRKVIVANSGHDVRRRRVSIARQLGFLILHRRLAVRVDEGMRLALDDPFAGTAETIEDVEASLFALHLLMPQAELETALAEQPLDFNDEARIAALADRFGVPAPVLVVRCLTLHN